jgi:hypothetical protein
VAKKSARRNAKDRHATADEKAPRAETRARRLAARKAKHKRGIVAPSSDPSYRRKLAWAEAHISDAKALIAGWNRDGYRTFYQPNGNGGFTLFAQMLKPLPDDLSLVVGDALHCLRDSLDHIIFALSRKNPAIKTPDDEKAPQFPIFDNAVKPDNPGLRFLLDWLTSAEVCALAPDPARQPNAQHPLWLLDKMNNRDKHREIAFKPLAKPNVGIVISGGQIGQIDYMRGFGDQPMTLGGGPVRLLEFVGSQLQGQIRPTAPIVFDKGVEVEDREVISTLRWFHDHIRDTVFPRLEPFL